MADGEVSMEDRKVDDTDTEDGSVLTDDFMDDQQGFPNIDELDESNMPILAANRETRTIFISHICINVIS